MSSDHLLIFPLKCPHVRPRIFILRTNRNRQGMVSWLRLVFVQNLPYLWCWVSYYLCINSLLRKLERDLFCWASWNVNLRTIPALPIVVVTMVGNVNFDKAVRDLFTQMDCLAWVSAFIKSSFSLYGCAFVLLCLNCSMWRCVVILRGKTRNGGKK